MAMQFNVKNRDGCARIGEFLVENKKITTPNILFVNTSRFKAPDFADILITNSKKKSEKPSLKFYGKLLLQRIKEKNNEYCYVISADEDSIDPNLKDISTIIFVVANASQLFQQPKKFVEFITALREKIGYQKTIYLPTVGDPGNLALLTYMGIDFFDSTSAIIAARNNILLFPTGKYNIEDMEEIPCSCPACSKSQVKPSEMGFQQILSHNYYTLLGEIKQVRNAVKMGCLRELVETRVRINPGLTAILRNLDFDHYSFLEERTPLIRSSQLIATTKEALYRPEIKRFQERVIERYKKPESTKILVLLPCSAKKPYSFSKSHKLFREKIYTLDNPHIIHEVIITSPLGVVPRELELVYPASRYDIPVTGFWDEDEKKMIRELLQRYLKINKYDRVVIHLPTTIVEFIEDLIKNPICTCIDSPTSKKSLEKLSRVLKETIGPYERIKTQVRLVESVEPLASYQFGRKTAEKLLEGCNIKGRYPHQRIIYKGRQLGMITQQRGLISLTLEGARRIVDSGEYWVDIYDDFTLKGSIFAPGVKDADKIIRLGDEVIVLKNNKLCAVGVAQMSGNEMKESLRGEAVKTRHRI